MNRLDQTFERTREQGRAALIPFLTAGDPDLETTAELIAELADAGADVIELGVPHSDPIAEGPTIQAASARAVAAGIDLGRILELCAKAREHTEVPVVLMGYLNNVLARGEARFVDDCAAAGVDAIIVVDAPYEEAQELSAACEARSVHRIQMVAPTSTPERVVRIAARARGFVYCVSVTGVTGARAELPADLEQLVGRIRRVTDIPVCVGFGISDASQAARVARLADGVIVGSALVSRIAAAPDRSAAVSAAGGFIRSLRDAVREARR